MRRQGAVCCTWEINKKMILDKVPDRWTMQNKHIDFDWTLWEKEGMGGRAAHLFCRCPSSYITEALVCPKLFLDKILQRWLMYARWEWEIIGSKVYFEKKIRTVAKLKYNNTIFPLLMIFVVLERIMFDYTGGQQVSNRTIATYIIYATSKESFEY